MSRWRDRIRISGGFWLLAAWFTLVNGWQLLAVILSAAALHELGHLLVLRLLGAEAMIVTNAAGAVNTSFSAGDIMLITDDGTIIRMAAADVNVYSRTAQGVRVMRVSEGTKVISLARVPQEEDKNQTEEAAEETTEPADAPAKAPASDPQEETP